MYVICGRDDRFAVSVPIITPVSVRDPLDIRAPVTELVEVYVVETGMLIDTQIQLEL